MLGSLLGGGSSSVSGAIKGEALAMLAGIAYKALTSAGQGAEGGSAPVFSGSAVPVGMTTPQTSVDHQVLANTAEFVIKGMINAVKADGEVSADEITRIVGKLKEAGMTGDTEAWIMKELRQLLDLDAFAAAIPNPEIPPRKWPTWPTWPGRPASMRGWSRTSSRPSGLRSESRKNSCAVAVNERKLTQIIRDLAFVASWPLLHLHRPGDAHDDSNHPVYFRLFAFFCGQILFLVDSHLAARASPGQA